MVGVISRETASQAEAIGDTQPIAPKTGKAVSTKWVTNSQSRNWPNALFIGEKMAINIYQKIQTLKYAIKQKNVELNYYINMQKELEGNLTVQEVLEQKLTPHQRRVAQLVQQSMTNAQIANALQISPKTVKYHLTHIFAYLNCDTRHELKALLDGVKNESKVASVFDRPADGSTQAILGRLSSGTQTSNTGISLPFGTTK